MKDPHAYPIGYRKPPAQYRFQKGISGNPAGRPRKADLSPQHEPPSALDEVIVREAERKIRLRENDQDIELTMIEAVMRSLGVAAVKGNFKAQLAYARLVEVAQARHANLRQQFFETVVEYRDSWERIFMKADRDGRPRPDPLPHPADIVIDLAGPNVVFNGPITTDEKAKWDQDQHRRAVWLDEACHLEKLLRKEQRKPTGFGDELERELDHARFMASILEAFAPDETIRRQPGFKLQEWRQKHPAMKRVIEGQTQKRTGKRKKA